MLALIQITAWHWVIFIAGVIFCLALDLGIFHRHAHVVSFKEALAWTAVWVSLAIAFAIGLVWLRGRESALAFVAGYLTEYSLSMDNVFVIALIFAYFRVPLEFQHRVLFWGIIGALVMRGVLIGGAAALVHLFEWILYVFGAFLVVSGIRMLFAKEEGVHPEKNPFIRLAQRFFPISAIFDGQKFFTRINGKRALTPLALVLVMVETTDLIFAVDSIPAIFGITKETFIVFTSNIFAILGLRSLYFVLAVVIDYFRYLKIGLAVVLVFIGVKMLIEYWVKIGIATSLAVVAGVILTSILISLISARRERPPEGVL